MRHRLPSLTILLVGLAGSPAAVAESPTAASVNGAGQGSSAASGGELVASAARRLAGETSLECRLRQRIVAFGHELIGAGGYLQFGPPSQRRFRMELKLQVGNQVSSIQQICDSRRLWIRRDFPDGASLVRVDLRRVRESYDPSQPTPAASLAWLDGGGLPGLLESLSRNFRFESPQAAEADGLPVWVVQGTWAPPVADRKGDSAGGAKAKPSKGPTPEKVTLTLSRDSRFPLFPYRIEYFPRATGKAGAGQGGPQSTIEFYDVRRLPHVDPRQFEYLPGDQEVVDGTSAYVARWLGNREPATP